MGDKQDPESPNYFPSSDGGRDVGDVGSGDDFGADTYKLYLAGRVLIPTTANLYSENTNGIYDLGTTAAGLASKHPALMSLSAIPERMHHALYRTSQSLHQTAEALVEIADDYVRTDEAARDEFLVYLKDDRVLDKDENSLPPLRTDQLPEDYVKPIDPGTYGTPPEVPGPGRRNL
ncbi:hypothetical protein [Nocardioides sp. B-3]|uniref:hypothetical protein n=1 Tax=Nocardioides sp. B-3 TaxID=2895565 RepID=UPI0021531F32|nr:hypothetical protein [Nocardioides sp. B-3]UUZ60857.1 hypothetical protein LP418_09050 [Nocardioides sp. B-3]